MCIACNTEITMEAQDTFGERLVAMVNNGMTSLMVSLGHRAGLFDAMADGAARSSAELALESGLHERYVREWLGAMVVSRIVMRDPHTNTYQLPAAHAASLTRQSTTGNLAVFAQYLSGIASVEDAVLNCFHQGGGVPYAAFPRFHDVMEEESSQTTVPMILEIVAQLMPGLMPRLEQGIDVLDVGCGRGRAIMRLAEAFPASRFTGYDLSEEAVAYANRVAAEMDLDNIHFVERDLTHWDEPDSFDWIMAFDAIHDQARPDKVLAAVRRALRPRGMFLMQDIGLSSEPCNNMDHPLGPMVYSLSCMHCMTVSLAQGGMGLGAAWGVETAETMLREAGFEAISVHHLDHDDLNAYFIMQT